MGIDLSKPLKDIPLDDEKNFRDFGQACAVRVATSEIRAYKVAFILQVLNHVSDDLTSDDLDKIEVRVKALFNQKLKDERGKDTKKKATKAPKINVERGDGRNTRTNAGYDMYEVEGMEGTDQYGGYDEIDFM